MSTSNPLLQLIVLQPVNVVQLLFTAICLFGLALLHRKPRFFGLRLLLLLETLLMLFNFAEETGIWTLPFLVTPVFSLCTGPVIYFLVTFLVYARRVWKIADWLHFVPAAAILLLNLPPQIVLMLGTLSLFTYAGLAFKLLASYHRACSAMQSDTHLTQLMWLKRLFVLIAALAITDAVRVNLQPFLDYELRNLWYLAHQTLAFLFIVSLIFFAVRQPKLFDLLDFYQQQLETPNTDCHLHQKVFAHIDQQIRQHHWYQQPRLSLMQVAERLELDSKTVSAAINQSSKQNFSSYINRLRVLQVKAALDQSPQSVNLLQLAFAAGFNSKSVFNKVFKQEFGTTPSDYIKQKSAKS